MDTNPPLHNAIVLKESEEKRLDELFSGFAKSDPTGMILRFSELLQLALDRNIIQSKISFSILYDCFLDCIDENLIQQTLMEDENAAGNQRKAPGGKDKAPT